MNAALIVVSLLVSAPEASELQAQSKVAGCRTDRGRASGIERHLERGDLRTALQVLWVGLASPENCHQNLVDLYTLLGRIEAQHGDDVRCRRAFERALALSPELKLDAGTDASSAKCFELARWTPLSQRRLVFRLKSATVGEKDDLRLSLDLDDPLRLASHFAVYYRRANHEQDAFVLYRTDRADPSNAFVDVPLLAGGRIEYFVVLADDAGGQLARIGSPDQLLTASR